MPPWILKPPGLGVFERQRKSGERHDDQRQADHQRQADQENRRLLARLLLPAARPDGIDNGADDADAERNQHPAEPALEERLRDKEAAVVEEDAAGDDEAFADRRQRLEHGVVPEQQLQQQRQIADGLDVARRRFGHQPVLRQPRNADDEAEDGGEHDAEPGHQQRVEQADVERAAVSRGRRVECDQRLADVEAGGMLPKAEAGSDMRPLEIDDGIAGGGEDEKADDRAQRDLIGDAADLGIVVERNPRGERPRR